MSPATPPPDSPAGRLERIYRLQFAADVTDNLDALRAITALRADLSDAANHAALSARGHGASWEEIAEALVMPAETAREMWGRISAFAGWDR